MELLQLIGDDPEPVSMDGLFDSCEEPPEAYIKAESVSKAELREKLGLTRENLKFHLMDRKTGLIPNGIVKEHLGKLTLNFRDTESVLKAVNYIATRKAIREAIEEYFAEAFISVYGEFFHCDMYDLEQLSQEDWHLYNDLHEKARLEMAHRKRLRIGYREIALAKGLLAIRRGQEGHGNDPKKELLESPGFMFLYARYASISYSQLKHGDPKKLSAERLTLSPVPIRVMYRQGDLDLKEKRTSFNYLLMKVIRRAILEVTNPEDAGIGPDNEVPRSEHVLFNYITGQHFIEAYNIEDLEQIQKVMAKAMQDKIPLGYEVIQSEENGIILRATSKYDL